MPFARTARTLVLASLASTLWAQAQPTETAPSLDDRLAWISAEFDRALAEHHAPGAALAVIKDGEVILLGGFGVADTDTGRPVTPDTRFAVGSTTKAFTASAIGMLVDEGRMSFDEPARTHLPAFHLADPDADSQVVIRDLLCHRAGLAVMNASWYGVPGVTRDEIIEIVGRAELLFPFREQWNYSNESFLAAGLAAGNAAGTDWDTLIATRILGPLGMTETNTTYDAAQADTLMAKGYFWHADKGELEHQPMRNADAIAPAGSINSSVRDMSRWVIFQLGRGEIDGSRLLSETTHAETWTHHMDLDMGPLPGAYGLGWFLGEWEGRRMVEHAGGIDGFTAEVAMLPEENLGMVMLTNQFGSPLQEQSRKIVFRGMLGDISETAAPVSDEDFGPFLGDYTANFGSFKGATMKVLVQNGRLAVDVPGQMVYELAAPDDQGKRAFTITDAVAVKFNQNDRGEVFSLTIFQGGMTFEVIRAGLEAPIEIDLAEARDYLGVYHLDAPGQQTDVSVLLQNNRLAIDHPGQMVYELYPPDADGWMTFRVTDAIRVRFDRDEAGKVVSITHHQGGAESVLPRLRGPAEAELLPTVEDLLARAAEAGAVATGATLRSLTLEGSVRAVHMGLAGPERAAYTADGKVFTSLDLGGGRLTETWIDGERALTRSFAAGDTELTPDQQAAALLQSPLAWATDWRESFDTVAVTAKRPFDNRDAFAIRVTRGDQEATMFLDAETSMPLAIQATIETGLGGAIPITLRLSDWRQVGPVKIAHRQEVELPMAGILRTEYATVEVNQPIDESVFHAPEVMGG
ncbi:MAG: beta-lactamase family protein [Phycisphaerales bacterium]|nr:beta-lactamase family protein [Phycisphaerales bacterium]